MSEDERAIRNVITSWLEASAKGDISKVLSLMSDDVVFMTPGRDPFGKAEFEASSREMSAKGIRFNGTSEVLEIEVSGDWAYSRTRLNVTVDLPDGSVNRRSGYTMSVFRRGKDGRWVIARDANLLT